MKRNIITAICATLFFTVSHATESDKKRMSHLLTTDDIPYVVCTVKCVANTIVELPETDEEWTTRVDQCMMDCKRFLSYIKMERVPKKRSPAIIPDEGDTSDDGTSGDASGDT